MRLHRSLALVLRSWLAIFRMSVTLSGSGFIPSGVYLFPKKETTLLDVAFLGIEYQALSFCLLHQVNELSVMVFLILHNVVGYRCHTCQTVNMLIHPALEYVLRRYANKLLVNQV